MNSPVILDGAWGTELQARGLEGGDCPDAWNLAHPDRVAAVAEAYVQAGSRIILTNTFRANRIALRGYGLAERVGEINAAGVELSRRAARGKAGVYASMGPSGKMLAAEEVSEQELCDAYGEQAEALARAGADGLVVETMSDLDEACIAVQAAKLTGLPVAGCMVFDSGKNKDRTMMGATPEQAAARLAGAGADIIGANCGCGIERYVDICVRLVRVTSRPVWIKANAGLPEIIAGRSVYRMTPVEFAGHVVRAAEAGAAYVGGCCGTSPAFVSAIRDALLGASRCA